MECRSSKTAIFPECHQCAENLGRTSLWANVGLAALKLVCGAAGDSRAVVADAVHSTADAVLAVILMICLGISKAPPDREHPYGHGNIEYIATLFVGLSLTTVATLIVLLAAHDIVVGVSTVPNALALVATIISIVANELMFRHSLCCGERFNSPAMIANAWENRADAYSSVGALVGVVGAKLGLLFMDPVGAILVSVLLYYTAYQMMRTAWRGILDHSLDEPTVQTIRGIASRVAGVRKVASLRTRAIGQQVGIDIEIVVDPELSLVEACDITDRVKAALCEKVQRVGVVTVTPVGGRQ
jgi:cation diffusion facilitator family transporter